MAETEDERAPADAETIENTIDRSTQEGGQSEDFSEDESSGTFENLETGVLEHDLARHEAALLDDTDEGEALDLGRVEGLSGAPSTLRDLAGSEEIGETEESDTMKQTD